MEIRVKIRGKVNNRFIVGIKVVVKFIEITLVIVNKLFNIEI